MRSAIRKADISGLAWSSSSIQDWVLLASAVPYAVHGSEWMHLQTLLENAVGRKNFVKIHQASWKLSLQSTETKALAVVLSQHIWRFAMISISECTITYSLFFSQLLTPSVSTPRIACWRINRVLPLLHMAVLHTVPLPTEF